MTPISEIQRLAREFDEQAIVELGVRSIPLLFVSQAEADVWEANMKKRLPRLGMTSRWVPDLNVDPAQLPGYETELQRRQAAGLAAPPKRVVQGLRILDHDPIMHFDVERNCPMVGGTYRHYKGGLYTVVAIATNEGSKTRCVVYRGADGHVWVRPLSQWFEGVKLNTGDRATVTRFAYDPQTDATVSGSTQST